MIAKKDRCEFFNPSGELSCMGIKHGNIFRMLMKVDADFDCNATAVGTLSLWHERLVHINKKTVTDTIESGAVEGAIITKEAESSLCQGCQFGKQCRRNFPESTRSKTNKPGEFIHTDVCGPMNVMTPSGSKYFLLFKDDCSGFRKVYFLKQKSEVCQKFKDFEKLVKRQTGNSIKSLRSDCGTEYLNRDMADFLRNNGIVHETSAPYTPEQNGRSEREIRTITESARSMLCNRNISPELWAEDVNTAVYVLNRTLSKQLANMTPYEKWFVKPSIVHVRVFGAVAYMHHPKQVVRKWDPRSRKMIFVGYENDSKNYRLWDPEKRKVYVSANVKFDESTEYIVQQDRNENRVILELKFGNENETEQEEIENENEANEISRESNNDIQSGRYERSIKTETTE